MIVSQAAILALFLPWVTSFLTQLRTVRSGATGIDAANGLLQCIVRTVASIEPLAALPVRFASLSYTPVFAGLLTAGVIAGSIYAYRKRSARGWAIMATLLLASVSQAIALRIAGNVYIRPNYIAFVSIFGCVLAGMALGRARSTTAVGLTVAICLMGLSHLPETYRPIDDWRGAANLLARRAQTGDFVATLYNGAAMCVHHYAPGINAHGLPDGVPGVRHISGHDLICAVSSEHIRPIEREFSRHRVVWMVWYHTSRGNVDRGASLVRGCLARQGFVMIQHDKFPSIVIERYARVDPDFGAAFDRAMAQARSAPPLDVGR